MRWVASSCLFSPSFCRPGNYLDEAFFISLFPHLAMQRAKYGLFGAYGALCRKSNSFCFSGIFCSRLLTFFCWKVAGHMRFTITVHFLVGRPFSVVAIPIILRSKPSFQFQVPVECLSRTEILEGTGVRLFLWPYASQCLVGCTSPWSLFGCGMWVTELRLNVAISWFLLSLQFYCYYYSGKLYQWILTKILLQAPCRLTYVQLIPELLILVK